MAGVEAGPGVHGGRWSSEPPLPDRPSVFGDRCEAASVELKVDQGRPAGGWAPGADRGPQQPIGEQLASAVPYLQRGLPQIQRLPGALRQCRPELITLREPSQDNWCRHLVGRQDAGKFPAGAQPAMPVVHANATPVPLGRTFVVVQAGEHQTVRPEGLPQTLRVLQQPGIECLVLRHQPHPARRPKRARRIPPEPSRTARTSRAGILRTAPPPRRRRPRHDRAPSRSERRARSRATSRLHAQRKSCRDHVRTTRPGPQGAVPG